MAHLSFYTLKELTEKLKLTIDDSKRYYERNKNQLLSMDRQIHETLLDWEENAIQAPIPDITFEEDDFHPQRDDLNSIHEDNYRHIKPHSKKYMCPAIGCVNTFATSNGLRYHVTHCHKDQNELKRSKLS